QNRLVRRTDRADNRQKHETREARPQSRQGVNVTVTVTTRDPQTSAASQPATGPLKGVRIVEFVGIGPGPFACMMLADMGAEVITLDRVGANKIMNSVSGRGRKVVELDLKDKAS